MEEAKTTELPTANKWFMNRPIPVWIITAFCCFQFIGILAYILQNSGLVLELLKTGAESPIAFISKLLYPFLLFLGGLFLFFLRKFAIYFFIAYLLWGVTKIIGNPITFYSYLSLAIVVGVCIYCFRLRQKNVLK